jgi:hypothetical protein
MRPTKSLSLCLQMQGRALRRAPGKTSAKIFDHAGNWLRHGLYDVDRDWSLEGRAKRKGEAPAKKCPGCHAIVPAAVRECPECGYEFEMERKIAERPGELREITRAAPPVQPRPRWITVKFQSYCAGHCGHILAVGSRALWYPGQRRRIYGADCGCGAAQAKVEYEQMAGA